jgi:hypothetical protein
MLASGWRELTCACRRAPDGRPALSPGPWRGRKRFVTFEGRRTLTDDVFSQIKYRVARLAPMASGAAGRRQRSVLRYRSVLWYHAAGAAHWSVAPRRKLDELR